MEERNGYIVIDEAYGSECYDWCIVAALYHPEHDAYYLYEDGGCSCNYPYEDYFDAGRPMSKQELVKVINATRTDDAHYYLRLEDYLGLAQSVREFDPKEVGDLQ